MDAYTHDVRSSSPGIYRGRGPRNAEQGLSYCGWSETCDLCCFSDGDSSWTTHVVHTRRAIGLPFDGETFNDTTLYGFLARLITLRDTGYRFPDDVLERIDREIAHRFD